MDAMDIVVSVWDISTQPFVTGIVAAIEVPAMTWLEGVSTADEDECSRQNSFMTQAGDSGIGLEDDLPLLLLMAVSSSKEEVGGGGGTGGHDI
jgi:hypothetical protein